MRTSNLDRSALTKLPRFLRQSQSLDPAPSARPPYAPPATHHIYRISTYSFLTKARRHEQRHRQVRLYISVKRRCSFRSPNCEAQDDSDDNSQCLSDVRAPRNGMSQQSTRKLLIILSTFVSSWSKVRLSISCVTKYEVLSCQRVPESESLLPESSLKTMNIIMLPITVAAGPKDIDTRLVMADVSRRH